MKVTPERLRRLERGRTPSVTGRPAALRRRLAVLEAEFERIKAAYDHAEAEHDPRADDLLDELLACFWSTGICAEIDRIKRALLSPAERARRDRERKASRARFEAMSVAELDAEIARLLADSSQAPRQSITNRA